MEANFDGLVGPTHNYAGLSLGNVASMKNKSQTSNPKAAALQGLEKMKSLWGLGLTQGVIPPQERPDVKTLRNLGFDEKSDHLVIEKCGKSHPELLSLCSSASSMWTANAATVSPSADTGDSRVHITPANLANRFHRSIEPPTTTRLLRAIFRDENQFVVHEPLPTHEFFGDEGAANHTRFCRNHDEPGIELFVYGRRALDPALAAKFPARQTLEASQSIARAHKLKSAVFVQQNPDVIERGVFHNDVISVGNQDVFFCHEMAFKNLEEVAHQIEQSLGSPLRLVLVRDKDVSVEDCVDSYLFNSQLVTLPTGRMVLILPEESRRNKNVLQYLEREIQGGRTPISGLHFFDLKQSMQNGGGPACLRLRVSLSEKEALGVNPKCLFSEALYSHLKAWVEKHYRDRLTENDLIDPHLLDEGRRALDELTEILDLGSVYPFQRTDS